MFHADGEPIGNLINTNDDSSFDISIRRGSDTDPDDDPSAFDVMHRYAKQIVGAVSARAALGGSCTVDLDPFNIPNTFEARSGVRSMQDRIRHQRIVIIGLGGTGAYLLDLLVKTPVAQIHLYDFDDMEWHNFLRAPGAPTSDEINSQKQARLSKVSYYSTKYAPLRDGVVSHAAQVTDPAALVEFLSTHSIDFAFVSIDQRRESDSPRQDAVYDALSKAEVPFIDSGVSITIENERVRGAVTTSGYLGGSVEWKQAIPNARMGGDAIGYRNVQLPEVNALAASLSVMEWRRRTDQYANESRAFLHRFRLESAQVRWSR